MSFRSIFLNLVTLFELPGGQPAAGYTFQYSYMPNSFIERYKPSLAAHPPPSPAPTSLYTQSVILQYTGVVRKVAQNSAVLASY